MINSVIHTNQQSIDRVLKTGLPLALVFWNRSAPLNPVVETLLSDAAEQLAGKLLIAKVDGDAEPALRQRYQVQQLPALVFVKGGQTEGMISGSIQPDEVRAWLAFLTGSGVRPTARPQSTPASNGAGGNGKPLTLTESNFDRVIGGSTPVLVDFWAPWCGPCRTVAPAVEQVAGEFAGRALVGKLNVDDHQQIAQRYGIQGIPALLIFKKGQVVDQLVGAQPVQVLQQRLRRQVEAA
jgi:thioredoxin 1